MSDDDFFARLVPVAVVVDAGESADGADDGVGAGDDALGLLDEEAECVAGLLHASVEEAEGVGVSVNDTAVAEIEFVGDDGRAVPVKDALLDGFAFGVVADGTVGDVTKEGAVGAPIPPSNPLGLLKTRTLSRTRKGCGTRNIKFKFGNRKTLTLKTNFRNIPTLRTIRGG